jgi:hypothetical protein
VMGIWRSPLSLRERGLVTLHNQAIYLRYG